MKDMITFSRLDCEKGVMTCGICPDIETCQYAGAVISNNRDVLKNLKG